jgi:hypothetical protein
MRKEKSRGSAPDPEVFRRHWGDLRIVNKQQPVKQRRALLRSNLSRDNRPGVRRIVTEHQHDSGVCEMT